MTDFPTPAGGLLSRLSDNDRQRLGEAMRRLQKATKASDPLSVAEHIARARNLVQTGHFAWERAESA